MANTASIAHHVEEPPSPTKLRWWIACFVSAIVLSPVCSVLLGLHLHARDFQDNEEGAKDGFTGRTVSGIGFIRDNTQ